MSTYFPFFRGKQSELLAVRELSARIADSQSVKPIIEPVNGNATTILSLNKYVAEGMHFGLIVNPTNGIYAGKEKKLYDEVIEPSIGDYDNYFPILQLHRDTLLSEVERFNRLFGHLWRGVIYNAEPDDPRISEWATNDPGIYYHIFIEGNISVEFMNKTPLVRRVIMRDNFRKQPRNSDYPSIEMFTDLNTTIGNPGTVSWGDYSIVGDHYSEKGAPPYCVAIHHIHAAQNGEHFDISHVLSDRQDSNVDTSGKVIEAVQNLVSRLDNLYPNDTSACREYRKMARTKESKGLGYLKKLGIRHHLELFLPQ